MVEKSDDKENNVYDCKGYDNKHWKHHHGRRMAGGGGAVYCLGFIGALIFFINHATTFWEGVLGFFQALVWPAYLVNEALKALIK